MLMSSSVRPDEAPPSFLTLVSSCAGQLAVTHDLFALTGDPCTRSHATPFCPDRAMATPQPPLLR
ncbi:H-2 class I histocompatibility antigen, K-K alpha chain-like, partial [Clarias magur]